jgi:DNA-3-methyladenine glycosylase I
MKRCKWVNADNALYVAYHDTEWGVPVHNDITLFEMLILEGAQAGLSWETVLKKRGNYRIAFKGFDPRKVARFSEIDVEKCMQNEGIIRNRLKITSAVKNAAAFIAIQKEFGSFDHYIWSYVNHTPLNPRYESMQNIPTRDELSDRISKDLKKRGMSFVGSTIIYAYMQAVGIINAHTSDCFRYNELRIRHK